jgi:hypothetical protein
MASLLKTLLTYKSQKRGEAAHRTAGQLLPGQKKALTDLLPVLLPTVSLTVTVFVLGRLFAPCPANP